MGKTFSLARFGTETKGAIALAQKRADSMKHQHASSLHLLVALLERIPIAADAVAATGANVTDLSQAAAKALDDLASDSDGRSFLSADMIELLRRAETEAGEGEVEIGDLMNALVQVAEDPTRTVLLSQDIKPGAFRAFFTQQEDPRTDEDEGEALLRDFASEVRGGIRDADERALRERGRAMIKRLAEQLSGRDGIPGLRVYPEDDRRVRLERPPRDGEIRVEWESDTGAVALHTRKHEDKSVTRYVWNGNEKRWASVEGGGFYKELHAALRACLFPEMSG